MNRFLVLIPSFSFECASGLTAISCARCGRTCGRGCWHRRCVMLQALWQSLRRRIGACGATSALLQKLLPELAPSLRLYVSLWMDSWWMCVAFEPHLHTCASLPHHNYFEGAPPTVLPISTGKPEQAAVQRRRGPCRSAQKKHTVATPATSGLALRVAAQTVVALYYRCHVFQQRCFRWNNQPASGLGRLGRQWVCSQGTITQPSASLCCSTPLALANQQQQSLCCSTPLAESAATVRFTAPYGHCDARDS